MTLAMISDRGALLRKFRDGSPMRKESSADGNGFRFTLGLLNIGPRLETAGDF